MSRLETRFDALAREGRTALVTFITAGDPDPETTLTAMRALVAAGADVIELGVPFSDPMADGPVIQRAGERALAGGMSVAGVLALVERFRREDDATPVVLMGYLNPIEAAGHEAFAERAAGAGVDGAIVVDLPPEEAGGVLEPLNRHGLDLIFLVAPTSSDRRIAKICEKASGFVYCVSMKGTTGAGHLDVELVHRKVAEIKAHTGLPVGVGFGIRDAETARRIGSASDAVIVGTALVRIFEDHGGDTEAVVSALDALVGSMRAALDGQDSRAVGSS